MTIYTDASGTGWGATDGSMQIFGFWDANVRNLHINYLELLTVKIALHMLASDALDGQILIKIDNTTALSYINKMGGVRFDSFSKLSREIWQWAESKRIILIASYIPSKQNIVADKLSRIKNLDIEWELNPVCYKKIVKEFGRPSIDLFASNENAKCDRFI